MRKVAFLIAAVVVAMFPALGMAQEVGETNHAIFVVGVGWETEVVVTNTTSEGLYINFWFQRQDGAGLDVDVDGDGSGGRSWAPFYPVPPGGIFRKTFKSSGPVELGWLKVVTFNPSHVRQNVPISSTILLRDGNGGLIAQAANPAAPGMKSAGMTFVAAPVAGRRDGVSIVNPNGVATLVTWVMKNQAGQEFVSGTVLVPAYGQSVKFADEFATLPEGFEGTLNITSSLDVVVAKLDATFNTRQEFIFSTGTIYPLNK